MGKLELVSLFTLGFSSLFPLINPVGTALIIQPKLSRGSMDQRKGEARAICVYSLMLGVVALFAGSWVLRFMGVSVEMTQLGGGLIIARMGLGLLDAKEEDDAQSAPEGSIQSSLFYPLAFPLTLGPGGISVLITLSAHAHGSNEVETFIRQGVIGLALFATLVITYVCLAYSDLVIRRIGAQGALVLNRLIAFLVFCIGLQVAFSGLIKIFPHLNS